MGTHAQSGVHTRVSAMNVEQIVGAVRFTARNPAFTALLVGVVLFPFTHFKPVMGLKLSEICLAASMALVLLNCARTKPLGLPVLLTQSFGLFLIVSAVSWLVATMTVHTGSVEPRGLVYEVPFTSILTIGRFVFSFAVVWLVAQFSLDAGSTRLIAKMHVIGGTLAAAVGLGLYGLSVFGHSIALPLFRQFGDKTGVWGVRLAGVAYEPGAFGNYFVSVIPITVAFYLSSRDRVRSRWLLAILIIQGLALGLTFSTGALGCAILAVAILAVVGRSEVRPFRALSLMLIAGALVGGIAAVAYWASVSYSQIYTIISKVGTESVSTRWATNVYLLHIFLDHPLFGIGIGNFAHVFGAYTQGSSVMFPDFYPADWRANNDYLTILAETGIIGFSCFALLLASVLREAFRVMRQAPKVRGGLFYVGVAAAVIGLLAQCWVAFTILNPYTWLLVGLLVASRHWLQGELSQPAE